MKTLFKKIKHTDNKILIDDVVILNVNVKNRFEQNLFNLSIKEAKEVIKNKYNDCFKDYKSFEVREEGRYIYLSLLGKEFTTITFFVGTTDFQTL